MRIIEIKEHSINKIMNAFLPYSNMFSFTIREGFKSTATIEMLLNDLSNYLIDKTIVNEWPGTKLLLGNASLFKYHLNDQTIFILSNYSNDIFDWVLPNLPEDLILYKDDKPIFISITHEKELYLEIEDDFDLESLHHLL